MIAKLKTLPAPNWARPFGPWAQGPNGYWYQISPFNQKPWENDPDYTDVTVGNTPIEFAALFGERPQAKDFEGRIQDHSFAVAEWKQELKFFKMVIPLSSIINGDNEYDAETITNASLALDAWGLGEMTVINGRYGHRVLFQESKLPVGRYHEVLDPFTPHFSGVVRNPGLTIANYQIKLLQKGFVVDNKHPFLALL